MSTRLSFSGITAAAIATAFLTAPAAFAAGEAVDTIGVQDKSIRAGQDIVVRAICQDPKYTGSAVTSSVLDVPPLKGEPGKTHASDGRVKPGTKPGKHTLSFVCGGKTVTGTFEVLPGQRRPGTTPRKPVETKPADQVKVKPKGAADTGGGAMAQQGVGESLDWLSGAGFAAGGLAAAAAGVIVLRNRRQKA
ncbi:hypothetical protein [Crossiella sp. NPDC003009]